MTKTFKTGVDWLDKLLPEGLPLHTSTLLSGPGGTGKPLIGDNFVAAWLRMGGGVVFMSLQYPTQEFVLESMESITGLDLKAYQEKVVFLSLDVGIEGLTEPEGNVIRANLVKPDIFTAAIEKACHMLSEQDSEIMVFGSALNLLLFSPTYSEAIKQKLEMLLQEDKRRTYIFSVSTTAKKEAIARLETLADNLIMTRSEKKPFRLYMQIVRIKDVAFSNEEVPVPISPKALLHVKEIADHSRMRIIPQVSKI